MDDEMLKDFVVEALELASNVEEHLLTLERHPDDLEILNAVFRAFHTIKGGAGFVNLPAMVSACHLTENLFDALRTGKAPVTPLAIEAAHRGVRRLVLEVARNNHPALALYAREGFVEIGVRSGYYRQAGGLVDAIVLARMISP